MKKDFQTFQSNILFLYNNFEKVRTSAKCFFTTAPYEVCYTMSIGGTNVMNFKLVKDPIPIGCLFMGWDIKPDLFQIEKDGKKGFIFHFSGSPLSGSNNWTGVILETGEIITGKDDSRFRERCEFINFLTEKCGKNLHELMEQKGTEHFNPYTLDELIFHLKEIVNETSGK